MEEKKIQIDDKGPAKIFERIVSLYLDQNLSMKDVAIKLSNEGVPTPSEKAKRCARKNRQNQEKTQPGR